MKERPAQSAASTALQTCNRCTVARLRSALRNKVSTIDFNLHGSYALTTLAIWNLNTYFPNYGIKDLKISSSTKDISYFALAGAPTTFAMGANSLSELAEIFSLGVATTASFVRFNDTTNYGGAVAAMSEVMFDTSPVA